MRDNPPLSQNIEVGSSGEIGSLLIYLGEYREAETPLKRVLELSRIIDEPRNIAPALSALANAYRGMSKYEDAVGLYLEALPILRQLGFAHQEAQLLGNLAGCLRNLGKFTEAKDLQLQCLAAYREQGNTREGMVRSVIRTVGVLGHQFCTTLTEASPLATKMLWIHGTGWTDEHLQWPRHPG